MESIMANALILATGFFLQYRALRCSSEIFSQVFVLGTKESKAFKLAVHCKEFIECDFNFNLEPSSAVRQINHLIKVLQINIVLPSDAITTRFLAEHGEKINAFRYPTPSALAFDRLNDKHNFSQLCLELNVPHPKTRVLQEKQELVDAISEGQIEFPVVAKPLNMWGSYGVR